MRVLLFLSEVGNVLAGKRGLGSPRGRRRGRKMKRHSNPYLRRPLGRLRLRRRTPGPPRKSVPSAAAKSQLSSSLKTLQAFSAMSQLPKLLTRSILPSTPFDSFIFCCILSAFCAYLYTHTHTHTLHKCAYLCYSPFASGKNLSNLICIDFIWLHPK